MSEVARLANSRTSECSASVSLDLKQRWSNLGGPQVVYLCLKLRAEGWVEAGWTGPASKLGSGSAGQRVRQVRSHSEKFVHRCIGEGGLAPYASRGPTRSSPVVRRWAGARPRSRE